MVVEHCGFQHFRKGEAYLPAQRILEHAFRVFHHQRKHRVHTRHRRLFREHRAQAVARFFLRLAVAIAHALFQRGDIATQAIHCAGNAAIFIGLAQTILRSIYGQQVVDGRVKPVYHCEI